MTDDGLELRLIELGRSTEWPPTPDLAASVRSRLAGGVAPVPAPLPRWRLRSTTRTVAAAAAVALVLALGFTPPLREAVAGWLGLTKVTIRRVPVLPSPFASIPAGRQRVSLAEAQRRAGFRVRVPTPGFEAVYLAGASPGGEVEFQLADGSLVTEAGGSFEQGFVGKVIGPGTTVSAVRVNGRPGAWISGTPHEVAYLDRNGSFHIDQLRIAGDVLIWEEEGVVLRVEGAAGQERALQVAAGLN